MESLTADAGLMLWTFVTFLCLFAVLAKFAFKPLKKLLDQRETTIRDSIQQAEQAKAQAERVLAQNEERLGQAREETRRIINEGHRIVADMKREAEEKARQESDRIVGQAREEIDKELQKSINELKGTVANLSVRISRQVIKENLDEKRHEELADDFIERLKKSHARR
jgi:F-type H+-transporting ATPase subunit b